MGALSQICVAAGRVPHSARVARCQKRFVSRFSSPPRSCSNARIVGGGPPQMRTYVRIKVSSAVDDLSQRFTVARPIPKEPQLFQGTFTYSEVAGCLDEHLKSPRAG